MGRDDNLLKGRQAERVMQGIRDYLAAFMAAQVNPTKNTETCEVEGLTVTYYADTVDEETEITIEIVDEKGLAPFRIVKLRGWFTH